MAPSRSRRASWLAAAVFAAAAFLASAAHADESARRFSVQLAIIAGDARLLTQPNLPENRRQGLRTRIASELSTLRLAAREYLVFLGHSDPALLRDVDSLRAAFATARSDAAARRMLRMAALLARRYPLDLAGLHPNHATPQARADGRAIYRTLCMGCHAHPDSGADNPAPDLFREARTLPEREFIARLLGGVRGTPVIALENPLSDQQIAGLAAYLRTSGDER